MLTIVVSLFFFVRATDFSKTMENVRAIGLGFPLLLLITSTAYAFGTLGWKFCLVNGKNKVSFWHLFMIRHVCETVGLFNPTSIVGGDLLKVRLLKNYGIPKPQVVDSVLFSRILMIISQLMLLCTALLWLMFSSAEEIHWSSAYIFSFLLALTTVLALAWFLLRRLAGKYILPIYASLRHFYADHRKAFALSFVFFTLHWVTGSLEFYAIMRLLGFNLSVVKGLLLDTGVVVIKSLGAFIPGQLGIEEIGNKLMLGAIGIIASSVWLSVSIIRRARQFIWLLAGGLFYLIIHHQRPKNGDLICEP